MMLKAVYRIAIILTLFAQVAVAQEPSCVNVSSYRDLDTGSTAELVKGSRSTLCGYYLHNKSAVTVYLKLYDKATAATVGTDTPKLTIGIPAGAAANVSLGGGVLFPSGMSFCATTGLADNNTTAPATNDLISNIFYK